MTEMVPSASSVVRRAPGIPEALPKDEFDRIFSKVPRLTVEVLIASADRGVLLALRDVDPCRGMWNLPGGTVRFGERLADAVTRVAAAELGVSVVVGALAGYIEYPSHYEHGLDSPVGLVFRARPSSEAQPRGQWFSVLPENMHEEQKRFLVAHAPVSLR
ncbi:MAG TPA: NUDIX domain-containing protein [Solirubrobacteraceae bacterium]|nr:NUDIX domain-containing protein [Solirubrobacteraceae bacterium]